MRHITIEVLPIFFISTKLLARNYKTYWMFNFKFKYPVEFGPLIYSAKWTVTDDGSGVQGANVCQRKCVYVRSVTREKKYTSDWALNGVDYSPYFIHVVTSSHHYTDREESAEGNTRWRELAYLLYISFLLLTFVYLYQHIHNIRIVYHEILGCWLVTRQGPNYSCCEKHFSVVFIRFPFLCFLIRVWKRCALIESNK